MKASVSEDLTECSRWKCYLHERQGVYQLLHVDIGDVEAPLFPVLSPCFFMHVPPCESFFHSSIRKQENASFNDSFLSSSAPLCRWAWSGPVMMNFLGVPE